MNKYNFPLLLVAVAVLIGLVVWLPSVKGLVSRVLSSVTALRISVDAIARVLGATRPASFTVTRVVFTDERILIQGRDILMIRMTDTQKCRVTFGKPVDKKNFPAEVQGGSTLIEATDDSISVVPVADDPFSVDCIAQHPTNDPLNPGGIKISADADLGDDLTTIEGFEPVLISAGQAFGFGAPTVSAIEEQ